MSKTELYLSKIIKYGLYAPLLTPLAFWTPALYGFLTPKFILFQGLVEIVFAIWLILAIYKPEYRPKFNWLTGALLVFIAISFISAFSGIDFSRSFWGIGARMTGLFAELHFLAWFLVLISYFKNDAREWHRYLNFSFIVSVIVALTAFYTNSAWRLVPGYTVFSNPTFAAPYFLFNFFWGLYQIWNSGKFNKLLFGSGSILILIALILGEIRGAIIGLLAGILFLGIGLIFSGILNRRRRIIITACYLLILLGIGAFGQWRNTSFVQNIDILKKFSEISTTTTAQTRLLLWQVSLKGFYDHPLLGVGPENFNYLFNAHYDSQFLKYGGTSFAETWQDKPHNTFLEVFTEIGLIGALAYIAVWLIVAFYLFKMFKNSQKFLVFILGSAFITYLGAIFFSFDSFGSWFGLYLFLAFLASHDNMKPPLNLLLHKGEKRGGIFLFGIFGLLLFGLLYLNYSIWRANTADADALRIFSKNPAQGINLFKKSLSYWTPYKSEYQFDLIASVAGAIEKRLPLPNLEDTINFSLDEANKAVAAHPKDAAKYADMAKIYNILGTKGRDPGILAQAETFGKKSLELSSGRQETLFYLARTALLKNDFKLAIELTKQAVEVDRGINLSHWYLGLSYIADNQRERGIVEIKKALEMGYRPQNKTEEEFIRNLGL